MVRDLKDVFVQKYSAGGGTEMLFALKVWFVMPAAVLFVMLFSVLINKFGFEKTLYIMVSIFTAFYAIFLLFLFPNRNIIHPSAEYVANLQAAWPKFLINIIPCLTNWAYSLFYFFSEIWGTMAISSLFWQVANQVTKKNEVKRFFGLYSLIGNLGVVVSGQFLVNLSSATGAQFDKNIKILIGLCVFFCFATMMTFYYVNNVVKKDPELYDPTQIKPKKKKEKIGMMDGIKFVCSSKYLLLIATLVLGYGLSVNLIESIWKEQMRVFLPNANDYAKMMGNLSTIIGSVTIIMIFISAYLIRNCSWKTSSLITPAIMLFFGGLFFVLTIYSKMGTTQLFGLDIAMLGVWVGLYTDAFIKSIKYVLFDPTKSMAYIPLDAGTRTKGQAAVEVVGGRLGKAGGSIFTFYLTSVASAGSKISAHLYTIIPAFALVVIAWIYSVFNLNKAYLKKLSEKTAN
jgi:AAA family ATP:ADP antiporter